MINLSTDPTKTQHFLNLDHYNNLGTAMSTRGKKGELIKRNNSSSLFYVPMYIELNFLFKL